MERLGSPSTGRHRAPKILTRHGQIDYYFCGEIADKYEVNG
jgi:hypothetical protein